MIQKLPPASRGCALAQPCEETLGNHSRVLVRDRSKTDLRPGRRGNDRFGAFSGIAAADSVDVRGRTPPLSFQSGVPRFSPIGFGRQANLFECARGVEIQTVPCLPL